jgi:hypothetical protein
MKRFHITFFIKRETEIGPLLSGVTVEAENMIFAINKAINDHFVIESEIKYIVEL